MDFDFEDIQKWANFERRKSPELLARIAALREARKSTNSISGFLTSQDLDSPCTNQTVLAVMDVLDNLISCQFELLVTLQEERTKQAIDRES